MFLHYSIAGYSVVDFEGIAMYTGTKHAVTALTDGLTKELTQLKSNIKIMSMSPEAVDSKMSSEAHIPKEMLEMVRNSPKTWQMLSSIP
ncbi:hypothetical protein PR048_002259 [Dryococelus australis]|uniref:Uncharacterized protein n=1 Tax=Dryococelus australis TaxID=614101 RepID=A0ABQ9IJP9_9NEOP|nr:hypothetical protein PR048_002259 [Dryococelus australis]